MDETAAKALASLPHGPEFRFVDKLVDLQPGKKGRAEYTVRGDESFLRGHFPNEPIFPGVLLIEAAAQLAGTVAQCDPAIPPLAHLRLTAVRGAKILGTARPGEKICMEAEVIGRMANLIQARATVAVNANTILQVELTLGGAAVG